MAVPGHCRVSLSVIWIGIITEESNVMFIELNGTHRDVNISTSSWTAIQEIAREFAWAPEYDRPPKKPRWSWAKPWRMTDGSSRALARALYAAIRAIEMGGLSEPLVELVKRV